MMDEGERVHGRSAGFLFGGGDDGLDALQFLRRKPSPSFVHQRRDSPGQRSVKERLNDASQRRTAGFRVWLGRQKDISRAILAMLEVAFLLEDAQQGAHRRIARRVGE